jgi:hypothetical protein
MVGDITVTGTTVDRNTGVQTGSDSVTVTLDGATTDTSSTDAQSNVIHGFSKAYITSKWFTGSVTISTTEVDLSDVDVYHCSFEQLNDLPGMTINTFDVNAKSTNANAWAYFYLYSLKVTGDQCIIANEAALSVASGDAIANQYWRLRRGNLGVALDGSTDGMWVESYLGPAAQTYWDDLSLKVWVSESATITVS